MQQEDDLEHQRRMAPYRNAIDNFEATGVARFIQIATLIVTGVFFVFTAARVATDHYILAHAVAPH